MFRLLSMMESENPEVRDEVVLLLGRELQAEDEIEERDRILQREESAVVQIRRRVLDRPQCERLEDALGPPVVEALDLEIMREVVGEVRPGVAARTLPLPAEEPFAPQLGLGRLARIEVGRREERGGRPEGEG